MINTINGNGFGGIEYLFSVPGLIGGAVAMNAGRGKGFHKSISDYVSSVEVINNGALINIDKSDCNFGYRTSIFKYSSMIITSVLFEFPVISQREAKQAKNERIALCKELQDNSKPNFGSVFSVCNPQIMAFVKRVKIGGEQVHFSEKTSNWIVNEGNGTFNDAIKAIKKVEFIHKVFNKECKREVIVIE